MDVKPFPPSLARAHRTPANHAADIENGRLREFFVSQRGERCCCCSPFTVLMSQATHLIAEKLD